MASIVHGTLVANTMTTVTLTANHNEVEVIHRGGAGAADIFFTVDGANPTVNGEDTDVAPNGVGQRTQVGAYKKQNTVVKLISSGTPAYTVRGL